LPDLKEIVRHYQQRFGLKETYPSLLHSHSRSPSPSPFIIVIPAYNEDLETTLKSLSHCQLNEEVIVLLVFNHSEEEGPDIKAKHLKQVERYQNIKLQNGLRIISLAAFDLPNKQAGVGLARKIGMDAALNYFAAHNHDGLIVCLDADCTVSENYLEELLKAERAGVKGLSIHYEHSLDEALDRQAIIRYEVFLRYYIQALRHAGYPHAFHTIGSSMAVRASAYAKIGGMNRRKAGEDFYFLHKLIPQGDFYDLTNCTVYPSSRQSQRVPFGTGRAMWEIEQGSKDFAQLYGFPIFEELKFFLKSTEPIYNNEFSALPKSVIHFLEEHQFTSQLRQLANRSSSYQQFQKNFSFWFDGFKVLKYVHFARDHYYGSEPLLVAGQKLLNQNFNAQEELLSYLRNLDRNSSFRYI